MSKTTLAFVFTFLACASVFAEESTQELSKALCGAPPADAQAQKAEDIRLHTIENNMPPVKNQNPSGWCFAFSATDIIDYYIHQKSGQPYSDDNQISPIDAVAAERAYMDPSAKPPVSHPGQLDFNEGGSPFSFFSSMQNLGALRSLKEIGFMPEDFSDPKSVALIDSIYNDYVARILASGQPRSCVPSEYDDSFISQLASFRMINNTLYQSALASHLTDNNGTTLSGYDSLAEDLDNVTHDPKVTIPPFTQQLYLVSDAKQYLSKLTKNLDSSNPVSIKLCDNGLPGGSAPDQPCGDHAMTAVGRGWEGGVCVIRLRNSWGKNWGSDQPPKGYIDFPVDQFIHSSEGYLKATRSDVFAASWITAPTPQDLAKGIKIHEENVGKITIDGTLYPNLDVKEGTLTSPDGSETSGTFGAGDMIQDGTVTLKDGTLILFKNGKPVPDDSLKDNP